MTARRLSRRGFLAGALTLAVADLGPFPRPAPAQTVGRRLRRALASNPFTLGVASGYPLPTSVVLWTRLAPTPLVPGGGMPPDVVPVAWDVAADDRMSRIVQTGTTYATPDWAHAIHVEVEGLEPGRWYWYRFRAGETTSPVGRTRTSPPRGRVPERLRFTFASCQQYEHGYFTAHRAMLADDPDLVVFLGDYIYETSWGRDHVRHHGTPEPHTLEDYRLRHALYKTDPDLQASHAACPWIVTWDDHEVSNDYAADRDQRLSGREWFLGRRAAAYRAYYEHMPLRREMVPFGPHMPLHHRVAFGDLVWFHLLDDRQYRSYQPCTPPGRGGSSVVGEECTARLDPAQTMLGADQQSWLEAGLDRSRARFNILAQQTVMAQRDLQLGPGQRFWTDGWDGYPLARRRLLDHIGRRKPANPVVISGDVHSFWVTDLKVDFDDARAPVVATEFVGSSVTSQAPRTTAQLQALMAENPHLRFVDADRRGYGRVDVTPERLRVDLRAMRSVTDRAAEADTLASFAVESGRPGAVRA